LVELDVDEEAVKMSIKTFLIAVLVLSSVVSASSYQAIVSSQSSVTIAHIMDADLAFIIADDPIAQDVHSYVDGRLVSDFGSIQLGAIYRYEGTLIIKNNKPYSVELNIGDVEGSLGTSWSIYKVRFVIAAQFDGYPVLLWDLDKPGSWTVHLEPDQSVLIHFEINTMFATEHVSLTGEIIWHATAES